MRAGRRRATRSECVTGRSRLQIRTWLRDRGVMIGQPAGDAEILLRCSPDGTPLTAHVVAELPAKMRRTAGLRAAALLCGAPNLACHIPGGQDTARLGPRGHEAGVPEDARPRIVGRHPALQVFHDQVREARQPVNQVSLLTHCTGAS